MFYINALVVFILTWVVVHRLIEKISYSKKSDVCIERDKLFRVLLDSFCLRVTTLTQHFCRYKFYLKNNEDLIRNSGF